MDTFDIIISAIEFFKKSVYLSKIDVLLTNSCSLCNWTTKCQLPCIHVIFYCMVSCVQSINSFIGDLWSLLITFEFYNISHLVNDCVSIGNAPDKTDFCLKMTKKLFLKSGKEEAKKRG